MVSDWEETMDRAVGVIGVPFCRGQPREGTELAPSYLRKGQIISKIQSLSKEVTDYGDLELGDVEKDAPWNKLVKYPRTVGSANQKIANEVASITKDKTALVLGGDHSIAMGSIIGHARSAPNLVVVWVDAHADINTPTSSTSGNMHGMPVAFLIKDMKPHVSKPPGFEWLEPCISAKDVVYIGLRSVDDEERGFLNKYGIRYYSMQEVDKYGIQSVVEKALKDVDPTGKRPIHVSFDVDALDPEFTPSTGTAVPGGLSLREGLYIAEEISRTGRLSVLDVVELNPALGTQEQSELTVETTIEVVTHFFGKRREGNTRPPQVPPSA